MKILINEKEYGLIWGIAAIDRYCTLMDMEVEPAMDLVFKQGSGLKQTVALAKFVTCAIDSYSTVHGTSYSVSYEQVLEEFDNQGMTLIQAILADFLNSKLLGQTVSEFLNLVATPVETGKAKKKQVQQKS